MVTVLEALSRVPALEAHQATPKPCTNAVITNYQSSRGPNPASCADVCRLVEGDKGVTEVTYVNDIQLYADPQSPNRQQGIFRSVWWGKECSPLDVTEGMVVRVARASAT